MEDNSDRHHSKYVSGNNVAHRCLMSYLNMFPNMSPNGMIQTVYDSCNRKGYEVSMLTIAKLFVLYRPEWRGKFILQEGSNFTLIE